MNTIKRTLHAMNEPVKTADNSEENNTDTQKSLTFWQVFSSTVAAALGVQSSKNRERDFKQGKALHFILMGIAFTVLFVLAVIGVVTLVLP
jgi:heme/copper-type cytochrome/quinol oxidase subunit 2